MLSPSKAHDGKPLTREVDVTDHVRGQEYALEQAVIAIEAERDHLQQLEKTHHGPLEGISDCIMGMNMALAAVKGIGVKEG